LAAASLTFDAPHLHPELDRHPELVSGSIVPRFRQLASKAQPFG